MIILDPVALTSPPHWSACDGALGRFVRPAAMGFACRPGDLNRFASRYRLAKSFQGVQLDSYTQDTVDGYAALLGVFLTYSAFEQFMDCCGLNLGGMEQCLSKYSATESEAKLRAVIQHEQFLGSVQSHLDRESQRRQFASFLASEPSNILYLAAGIRHIFAHGTLTPNSGAGYTRPAREVAFILKGLLFRVMDGEFVSRLRSHGIVA